MEYPFVPIAPRSNLTRRDKTWKGPIHGSLVVEHLNRVQTNDLGLIELLEIDLFDHLNVFKEMINIK